MSLGEVPKQSTGVSEQQPWVWLLSPFLSVPCPLQAGNGTGAHRLCSEQGLQDDAEHSAVPQVWINTLRTFAFRGPHTVQPVVRNAKLFSLILALWSCPKRRLLEWFKSMSLVINSCSVKGDLHLPLCFSLFSLSLSLFFFFFFSLLSLWLGKKKKKCYFLFSKFLTTW